MSYYAGIDCQCNASVERDCSCSDVDWTPTEVYKLREQLTQAKAELVTAKSDGIRGAIADYISEQPERFKNYYVQDVLERMNKYAYRLTNTTINKGDL